MGKIVKFDFNNQQLYKIAMEIRMAVFVVEQKVPAEMEAENEEESIYFLIYRKRKAVGTARYRRTDKGIKFERFAFIKEIRGKGYGGDILRYMLNDVSHFKQKIYLNAQISAVNFYKKYGFVIVGEKFDEAGIDHYPMEYEAPDLLEKALEKAICRR